MWWNTHEQIGLNFTQGSMFSMPSLDTPLPHVLSRPTVYILAVRGEIVTSESAMFSDLCFSPGFKDCGCTDIYGWHETTRVRSRTIRVGPTDCRRRITGPVLIFKLSDERPIVATTVCAVTSASAAVQVAGVVRKIATRSWTAWNEKRTCSKNDKEWGVNYW
jgi:hypothetical protein